MLKIIHVSAECFPIAKVGGLADVVGALPKYNTNLNVDASVYMPFYDKPYTTSNKFNVIHIDQVTLGNCTYQYEVLTPVTDNLGYTLKLFKIAGLTDREEVYGYHDDHERFLAFQFAVLDYILSGENTIPDILHCHDHHTGFIPFLTGYTYKYDRLKEIPTIFTIHNAQYQGEFDYDKLYYFPECREGYLGMLDWDGKINPLATAIKCSWRVTTVSPTYMDELKQCAKGLEGLLRHEQNKCVGVLNGIDKQVWDSQVDEMLHTNYSEETLTEGRLSNKKVICEQFNLDPNLPLVAFIGRFVYEKGSDLLPDVIENVLGNKKLPVSILILGSGDPVTTKRLEDLKESFQGNYNCFIGYNEKLSRNIYGSADFLLMPSRVEPCGLNQMYAMRYGMLPIVSAVGGLKDTVVDIDHNGYGIVCHDITVHEISFAIQRAVDVYNNTVFFEEKRNYLLQIDNGWEQSAVTYLNIYEQITNLNTSSYDQ